MPCAHRAGAKRLRIVRLPSREGKSTALFDSGVRQWFRSGEVPFRFESPALFARPAQAHPQAWQTAPSST